ncbi:uncharacterized protein LTR77_003114 [Saxophila tyrrhenica]|uniref:ABM domain-containing protein n=1 Tax=Saxophila tyrrhenica TaxID=1690608 RepID=A0AAV9PH31_9PEZI|nr:hypothetical protein LTR77_003114 [Saxophila tyrrhenica]
MPTTELATISLKAGSQIGEPNNPAAAVFKDCADTIARQDGFEGMQFDWTSKSKHEEFMASPDYGPFFKSFGTIIGGGLSLAHIDFQPEGGATRAMSAPVTEVVTFYFEGGPPDDSFESCKKFLETCEKESQQKVYGWAYGTTYEEIEKDGVKGKGAVLLIGWESRQEHMDFRETDTFKNNIHLLRQTAKGIEMHHTQFMNFVA